MFLHLYNERTITSAARENENGNSKERRSLIGEPWNPWNRNRESGES